MIRVGCGFDMHQLAPERKLILGGVEIPDAPGLVGHSDADALSHALCDALLGAAGLGDIGQMFPDSAPAFRGARSLDLLAQTREAVCARAGATIVNADATVALQSPQIAPYVESMRGNLARALAVSASRVSVKATTGEGLGFVGRKEGAAVFVVALLDFPEPESESE